MQDQELSQLMQIFDCFEQVVFIVENEKIVRCNRAAQQLSLHPGDAVEPLLGTNVDYYHNAGGDAIAAMTLRLEENRPLDVVLHRLGTLDVFSGCAVGRRDVINLDVLAVIAQTLRNPLTSVYSSCNNLFSYLEEQEDARIQSQTASLSRQYYRMLRAVTNLTDAAGYIKDDISLFPERRELQSFFAEIRDKLAPYCQAAGIKLDYYAPARPFYGMIDPAKIERALLNLVSNALKFTPTGGRLELHIRSFSDRFTIRVADNGEGMPTSTLATVFNRIEHRNELGDSRWGAGLGLPLVRHITELHGGAVIIESRPGEGTTATISLPLSRREEAMPLRSPLANYNYTAGFNRMLVELADCLPNEVFDSMNIG